MAKKDYTKYSKKHEYEEINEVVETQVEDKDDEVVEDSVVTGVITDCTRLNIRKKPNATAEIVCELPSLTEVVIDEKKSTKDFYKICTAAGIEGFCMKKFIAVRH